MALNFPASPNNGDVHNAANGLKYTYDGVKWTSQGTYSSGSIAPIKLDDIRSGFDGTTKTFNLTEGGTTVNAHSAESVLISVAGVVKEPTTDYTINVSAGTITFTAAPSSGQSFWGVVYSRLPIDLQTNLSKSGGTMTGVITFDSEQTFNGAKLTGEVPTANIADTAITGAKIGLGAVTVDKLGAATVVTNSEQAAATADDSSFFTTSASDARYFNVSTGDTIKDGDTFPDNDTSIATTAAINDRIIDLVDDVGGFVPIANETSFPNTNPDVNNGAGTLISIKAISSTRTPSGGDVTITDGAGSGNTVTITGCGSTELTATFGCIVETSATLHTYTFHRLTPKATEVTTVASNITNINSVAGNATNINTVAGIDSNVTTVAGISANVTSVAGNATNINTVAGSIGDVNAYADQYQIATTPPTTDGGGNSLANGDLWFDSSSNKQMMVYDGSAGDGFSAVTPSQSVLNDISNVSGQLTYAEDLGSIADALTTETGNNINTVATNMNDINSFADQYKVAASAPNSPSQGDLWYDSSNTILKYYNGSSWATISSGGILNLIEDQTPELYAALDCNDKNLTEVATVSGDNLQIDFGAIA